MTGHGDLSVRTLADARDQHVAAALLLAYTAGRLSMQPTVDAAECRATTDPLTGLPNRAGLDTELARLAAGTAPWLLAMLDLNGFKQVNDTYGHDAGDTVLVEVGRRLAALTTGTGYAARLGGDEFVLVGTCLALAEAFRVVCLPVDIGADRPIRVRCSIGVVLARPGDDPRRLKRAADFAMYQAKRAGGGVSEYTARDLPTVDEALPEHRLRDLPALARDVTDGFDLAGGDQ